MANNNLKEILEGEGIKQTELSDETKVSNVTINKICNQKRAGSPTTNSKLLRGINSILKKDKYSIKDIFPK